jgi:hypothetical protein
LDRRNETGRADTANISPVTAGTRINERTIEMNMMKKKMKYFL